MESSMMSTVRITSDISLDKLVEGLEQLDDQDLNEVVDRLIAAQARRQAPHLSKLESDLFAVINRGLAEGEQRRLDELISRRKQELLTPDEHAELVSWIERIEQLDAERVEALIALARFRNVSVHTLMAQLGIGPSTNG
jgi:hypothetical protein